MTDQQDTFTQAYITAMFFTDGEELGEASVYDIAEEAMKQIVDDCRKFQVDNALALTEAYEAGMSDNQAGHDFWLTRNGHGAGFWDGDWPEPMAAKLDEASKAFGEANPYLGDDGKIYL